MERLPHSGKPSGVIGGGHAGGSRRPSSAARQRQAFWHPPEIDL